LARVTGGNASVIDGLIRVSGSPSNLYLMNPAGILFGTNARLDVPAAFTATTANRIGLGTGAWFDASAVNDYASLTGIPNQFAFLAAQPGAIANFGTLSLNPGYDLALLGGTVLNTGTLSAPGGQIALAAVPGQTLVQINPANNLLSLEFQPLSGSSSLAPLSLPQLLTGGGVSNATGMQTNSDGTIQLTGSSLKIPTQAGTAIVSGQISVASASQSPRSTPSINLLGSQVGLFNATVDASQIKDGGTVRIGGDYQGHGTIPNALFTYVSQDTRIRADSLGQGNGGRIIVWADDSTRVYGSLSAQAGQLGGNGGLIETSGKVYLDVSGVTVYANAPQGKAGLWLLDPQDITIQNTSMEGGTFSGSNPILFSPATNNAIVSTNDITNALNNGISVTLTTGSTGNQAGNIAVNSPLNINANRGPTLTLQAANAITVNQPVSSTGVLNITLNANNSVTLNAPVSTGGGNLTSNTNTFNGQNQINTAGAGQTGKISINTLANLNDPNLPPMPPPNGPSILGSPQGNQPGNHEPGNPPPIRMEPGGSLRNSPSRGGLPADPRQMEQELRAEFLEHLRPVGNFAVQPDSQSVLQQVQSATGVKPALIYLRFVPTVTAVSQDETKETRSGESYADEQLELVLVTADGKSIVKRVAGATRQNVLAVAHSFLNEVTNPRKVTTTTYLSYAQQLYRWLIAPLEPELESRHITNLAFISVTGLRFIPMAALHDGHQFLVQKYSIGLMPSLSLTDTRYASLRNAGVLAAGASTFAEQSPLPAVPTELSLITEHLWQGRSLLNNSFTLDNLRAERRRYPFQVIHLATHGEFQASRADKAYIQLWDRKLQLDQLRDLGWNDPPVELLVLSACRTALGSDEAELGFAGVALQAGVKSALASLWNISDEGTLAFMSEFYQQLRAAPIKAEALRRAQVAMVQGQVKIQGGKLRSSRGGEVGLPSELTEVNDLSLSHPFYWAAFTLVGSPW
jgi:CHAT domain-containing protein